jgi:hypothetical protein
MNCLKKTALSIIVFISFLSACSRQLQRIGAMKASRPLNSILRRSLMPFMIIGIIASITILLPLEMFTLFRMHREQQRELTGAVSSSIRKHVCMADSSLQFLSNVLDGTEPVHLHEFTDTFDFFNQLIHADIEGGIITSTSQENPFSNIGSMIEELFTSLYQCCQRKPCG